MSDRNTWKGIEFAWNNFRMAFVGKLTLASKTYRFHYRETAAGDNTEAWVEWEGGYTSACVMNSTHEALSGAALALADHLQASLEELKNYL